MNTIFVQIASYRDPQLIPTLKNMIDESDHPHNLSVTVCWQHAQDETVELFLDEGFDIDEAHNSDEGFNHITLSYKKAKITLIDVPYLKSQGACWARNLIQQNYNKEKYTLQLDSHHRFITHWDTEVISMLESLRDVSDKPLLTAYIPSFDPENEPNGRVYEPWKMDFDRFIPEGAVFFIPSTIDNWKELKKPMRARFFSAHFAFADGSFAEEVQHDPEYFFHGEEISIAVRAFTHGYDLYHPHKVIAWHEYTRKGRVKVWDDHTTPQKLKGKVDLDWVERNDMCHKRNRILFGMDEEDPSQIDFGKYGFGTQRTLKDYEEYAGVSFKYRAVQQCVLDRLEPLSPSESKVFDDEEEWRNTLIRSNDIRILFHKSELGEICDDYDFWYVGTHDAEGKEIFRKDSVQPDINNYLASPEWIDFRLVYLSDEKATTFTVWPHSKSKGWLDRICKEIT